MAPSVVSQISSHAQKSFGSYALLAIAREPFELCQHFKSPSPVSRRELSIDLTWRASGPKPEFPAPEIQTESRCAQGERGVKTTNKCDYSVYVPEYKMHMVLVMVVKLGEVPV